MIKKQKRLLQSIAFELCRSAIWSEDKCTWLGPQIEFNKLGRKTYFQKPLGPHFYDGLSGVVTFLAAYLEVEKDAVVKRTLKGAVKQLIALQEREERVALSFFTGIIGSAYALLQAGKALNKKKWLNKAEDFLAQAKEIPAEHWQIDVIDGSAGAIPILLFLDQQFPNLELKAFACSLGDDLLEKASNSPEGISWDTMSGTHLLGFGHGTAGIANAFYSLYQASEKQAYFEAANKAIRCENTFFNQEESNWPDLRNFNPSDENQKPNYPYLWCHGAAGIGLSRIYAYLTSGQAELLDDLESATSTVLKNFNFLSLANFSLCHGLFGNADFLLEANAILKQEEIDEKLEEIVNLAIEEYYEKGRPFPPDAPGKNLSPCFMLGKSGIGYFLLRYTYPGQFPSILGLNHFSAKSIKKGEMEFAY